jgi:hypothetical protein
VYGSVRMRYNTYMSDERATCRDCDKPILYPAAFRDLTCSDCEDRREDERMNRDRDEDLYED